jgi:hypothetical protein
MSKQKKWTESEIDDLVALKLVGRSWDEIGKEFDVTPNCARKAFYRYTDDSRESAKISKVKVLLLDIETAPIMGYVWQLFDQNVALNQIHKDWHVLSWAAKWLNDPEDKVMYMDQRDIKNIEDDSKLLKGIWKLIDEADILLFQNGISFDRKKLNARFIQNGMKPPSSCRYIDTLRIARKHFAFTSTNLEYMTDKLCTKYKKLKHNKFSGFELWKECLAGNKEAWTELEKYNKYDILSMEELYYKLRPWDKTINFNAYTEEEEYRCSCGSLSFKKHGFVYGNKAKYQRYICSFCGAEHQDVENLLSKEKRKSIKK